MKNIILLILIFTFNKSYSQSGSYYRFLDNSNWCVRAWNGPILKPTAKYYSTIDTFVNGNKYVKIFTYQPTNQFNLLREDTIQKKVWIIQKGQLSESLLYDFSLPLGGQYIFLDQEAVPTTATLIKIDTVNINIGKMRRYTYYANSKSFQVVEGIGALTNPLTIGVFNNPNSILTFTVRACCHANTIIYINGDSTCCLPIITELNEFNNKIDFTKIILYPNPVTNHILNIESNQLINNIEIYNTLGVKQSFSHKNLNYFDLSNLVTGIYYVKIISTKNTKILNIVVE